MNIVRNVSSWLCLYLVATCFFLTANAFALFGLLNPDTIKDTLREENVYQAIVPAVLSTAEYPEQGSGQLPIREQWVRDAADKAFPAADLEQKTNTVIDSTFVWMEGKTERPEFTLDFTQNKQQLGTEVGNYTRTRLEGLPRCTPANLPSSIDSLSISCLPPGFSAASLASTLAQQVSNDQGFLKNPVISSEDLSLDPLNQNGASAQNPLAKLDGLQPLYQNKSLILIGLPVLTVLLAIGGFLLAPKRDHALRRLTKSFTTSALILGVMAVALGYGIHRLVEATATDLISRDILGPILTNLAGKARGTYLIFAVVSAVIAIILFVVRRKLPTAPEPRPQSS